jgi:hypothetical protein
MYAAHKLGASRVPMSTEGVRTSPQTGQHDVVATNRASQQDAFERHQYKQTLHAIVESPDQLLFIGEVHKSRNEARRRKHWSPGGRTTPFRHHVAFQGSHDPRYTLIGACDVNGFIFESCDVVESQRGRTDRDETHGIVDRERFELWVAECLVPVLGNFVDGEKRSIVVLDNAYIHHGERVTELIEDAGAYVLYTAPYSPDLNPIKLMFNQYKMGLERYYPTMHWFESDRFCHTSECSEPFPTLRCTQVQ